jgi:hypothetical protein
MPFDELKRRALEALAPRREAYHSAVATAVDEVRALLEAQRAPQNGKGQRVAAELGVFAAGRIDPERFGSLFSEQESLSADALERIQEALDTLTGLLAEGDDLYTVKLPAGGDLRTAVRDALAASGMAFGAGRAVENARTGAPAADYTDGFGPERWNRAERSIAPPLVVELDGADLRPAGLVDYLDGRQAMVLLVRKPAPPAALARLIAPGTLVAQAPSGDALKALSSWDGPAIVAIAPESAVTFRYLPEEDGAGSLQMESLPEVEPRALGGLSAARQRADLALLRMLDGAGAGRVVTAAASAPVQKADPTDKLAAWLLRQATIPEPGEG